MKTIIRHTEQRNPKTWIRLTIWCNSDCPHSDYVVSMCEMLAHPNNAKSRLQRRRTFNRVLEDARQCERVTRYEFSIVREFRMYSLLGDI